MKINEIRALRGPNYYSNSPVILMELDIGELEHKPTNLVPNFKDNIMEMLPTLYEHTCSLGVLGGFLKRIELGTWAAHVVEHVALELQCLIGQKTTFGKATSTEIEGVYNVVYRYEIEEVGIRAGEIAVKLVRNLFDGKTTDIEPILIELNDIANSSKLGPSTKAIVDEASRRDIPHIRLNDASYVQLGHGKYQRKIEATLMDNTSALGVSIAGDKKRTKYILEENGIPVPQGRSVSNLEEALEVVPEIGYPIVVKPLSGNHGRGVTTNITTELELAEALEEAIKISSTAVVEKFIRGHDFRIMVIDGKFQAAALREPAAVVGNGMYTIGKLIEVTNSDPKRGDGHENILTKISIDHETLRILELQDLTLDSILDNGQKLYLKSTANLSTGGTATDVTDIIHPHNHLMAERISKLIGLNVIGIDLIAENIEEPAEFGKARVVEVNAGPGFRMHLHPSIGKPRNIAKPVVDMLFPEGASHSVPICAITGTNGKTTTTRLISHILSQNGKKVGMTSSDGVFIDNVKILKGDYSGPDGAKTVLKDPSIDHGVFEVARGGIIRRGLGFDSCDIGILLNVTSDHLGFGGIDTLEELARLKSTVPEAVKASGYAILNADDPLVLMRADKIKGKLILFSKDINNPKLLENLEKGNMNISVINGNVVLQRPGGITYVENINDIPITFEGKATFNIDNVLAAVGATFLLGIDVKDIRVGLNTFNPSISQSPGRMNIIDIGDYKVVIDYCHNVGSVHASGNFLRSLMPGRKIRAASGVGNRRT